MDYLASFLDFIFAAKPSIQLLTCTSTRPVLPPARLTCMLKSHRSVHFRGGQSVYEGNIASSPIHSSVGYHGKIPSGVEWYDHFHIHSLQGESSSRHSILLCRYCGLSRAAGGSLTRDECQQHWIHCVYTLYPSLSWSQVPSHRDLP